MSKARKYFNETESDQVFLPKTPLWYYAYSFDFSVFKRHMSKRQFKMFLQSKNLEGNNIIHHSVSFHSADDMRSIYDQIVDEFGLNQTKLLYLERNKKHENILMGRLQYNYYRSPPFDYICCFLEEILNFQQIKGLLTDVDLNGNNVLFYGSHDLKSCQTVIKCFKKTFKDHEIDQIFIDTVEKALINHRQTPSSISHNVLKNLRSFLNLSDVEILFSESKLEKKTIAEACQLNCLKDFELWCFEIEFSSTENVENIIK
jgi:hypothetical protein